MTQRDRITRDPTVTGGSPASVGCASWRPDDREIVLSGAKPTCEEAEVCSLRLFVLFLIAATFGSAAARAEPVVVQSLPLGTAKTTGTHMSEGAALCSVRDRSGNWWLVVEDHITSEGYLGYIPAEGLETRPATVSAAERRRRPVQLPADATNSVDGLWTICGNWESSRCYMTFAFLQRGSRICGSYEHIGVANRIYRGRLAGRRNGNRIDIEYSCGRPSSYAMHWCPEDRVFKSDGWARTSPFPLGLRREALPRTRRLREGEGGVRIGPALTLEKGVRARLLALGVSCRRYLPADLPYVARQGAEPAIVLGMTATAIRTRRAHSDSKPLQTAG